MCSILNTFVTPAAVAIINAIGLALTLIGVIVIYINSPLNIHTIDGGAFDDDSSSFEKITERKNVLMRHGTYTVISGIIIQLLSISFDLIVLSA